MLVENYRQNGVDGRPVVNTSLWSTRPRHGVDGRPVVNTSLWSTRPRHGVDGRPVVNTSTARRRRPTCGQHVPVVNSTTARRRRPSCGQHVHGTGRHHQLLADSDPPVRSRAPSHHPSRLDQPGTSLIVALFILHVQLPVTDYSLSALYPVRRVAR